MIQSSEGGKRRKEKQIFFLTEMVRAILEGRKTVTRRVIKNKDIVNCWDCEANGTPIAYIDPSTGDSYAATAPCPYQPGDILWVRETWGIVPDFMGAAPGPVYKADYLESELVALKEKHYRWRPSIHMPREIARIFLRVTDVRVERLQDITEERAKEEGAPKGFEYNTPDGPVITLDEDGYFYFGFKEVWNRTIKPKDMAVYGWDANPWVWVIEFQRLDGKRRKERIL